MSCNILLDLICFSVEDSLHHLCIDHIMFTLHISYLTVMSGGGGGGVTRQKSHKPLTTVHVCVSTFMNMKPLDVFDKGPQRFSIGKQETSGHF